jgi:hypothetical protein
VAGATAPEAARQPRQPLAALASLTAWLEPGSGWDVLSSCRARWHAGPCSPGWGWVWRWASCGMPPQPSRPDGNGRGRRRRSRPHPSRHGFPISTAHRRAPPGPGLSRRRCLPPVPSTNARPPLRDTRPQSSLSLGVPTPPEPFQGQTFSGNDPSPDRRQPQGQGLRLPSPGATLRMPF